MASVYGEKLQINDLNINGLVDAFAAKGYRTTSSNISPLHPAQVEICNDPARFKIIACGRRFGKSLLSTFIAAGVAMQPGRKIWVVAATYELCDRVWNELYHLFVNEMKLAIPSRGGRANRTDRKIQLPNGSIIEGKSCERRDQLVGDSIDLLIFDEFALVPNGEDIFNQELRATLIDREGSAIFISTPRGRNHFYEYYLMGQRGMSHRKQAEEGLPLDDLQRAEMEWSSFRFDSYANTKENGGYLKKEEINSMRISMPDIKFRQECMADFTAIADSAFPEFQQEAQVVEWDFNPKNGPTHCGVDFNYATPCTTLYLQMDPNLNILVFDEYHPPEAHKTAHEQAQQLLEVDKKLDNSIRVVAADYAGKQKGHQGRSPWDDFADYGIHPVGRKQPVETGCDLIRLWCSYPKLDEKGQVMKNPDGTPVTYPKLFVHKRCKRLIHALASARAPETQAGVLKEGYQKDGKVDGPLDALRYIMVYLLHDSGLMEVFPAF